MPSAPFDFSNPKKLLAQLRPHIQKQLDTDLKKAGPSLKQRSQVALRTFLTGAILLPIAAAGGDPAATVQAVAALLGGLATEHFTDWVKKFTGAKQANDEALQQQLMQQAEASEEILLCLQHLLEKVEVLATVQKTLGEDEARWVKEQLFTVRPIPADIASHRAFAQQVKRLFQLKRSTIAEEFYLGGEQRADFLVTDVIHGEPLRTVVHCVTTQQGRADEEMVLKMLGWLATAKSQNRCDRGLIVTDKGLSPAAHGQAEGAGWRVRRYDDLLTSLMDFSLYLSRCRDDFTQARSDSGLPGLAEYYVSLKARLERSDDKAKPFDLLTHLQAWLRRPSPAPPLMLLGEYGTGKTTFCRKLAFELANEYLRVQDEVAAGRPLSGARPRLPLLINLLDFVEIRKLDALITHFLGRVCGVDQPRYELFEELNAAGMFVLILDGFDEMAVRVDATTIEKHLYHIEQLAKPANSRVLLAGRPEFFMTRDELERGLWPHRQMLANRFLHYEALRLRLWDDEQIQFFLNRLVPHLHHRLKDDSGKDCDGPEYYRRISQIPGFADDLAQRAVLLEMIAQTLPFFDAGTPVTRPNLYDLYLRKEIERQRLKKGREFLLDDDIRFTLLQELAADSFRSTTGGITYPAAEPLVKSKLPTEVASSPRQTEEHTREFLSCSFLRPGPGDLFVFSHRSFRGYFAAKELMPRLRDGSAKPQPLDQDCIAFLAEMMAETCNHDWYLRQVEAALKKEGLPDWIKKKREGGYFSTLPGGFEVEMVYVPAGPFVLGAEGELTPQIAVIEKGFWIDKTPVTNEQYQHFLRANPEHREPNANWGKTYNWKGRECSKGYEKHPVVFVSWNDAQAFCNWAGTVLPTEQQWEKAARGLDGRRWPWGNSWNLKNCNSASFWAERDLWYDNQWHSWWNNEYLKKLSGQAMTTIPGKFTVSVSPYFCIDSAGNVWEWCVDFYDGWQNRRVLRGGAWGSRPHYVACALRYHSEPDFRSYEFGFRCART